MNALDRYIRTLTAIHEGADTITGVAERLQMLRPTVETHFRWLREHRYIQGTRARTNQPAFYVTTSAGRAWLKAVALAQHLPKEDVRDEVTVGQEDEGITEKLYRWIRLSPPVVHSVRGRVHRLIDQENAA